MPDPLYYPAQKEIRGTIRTQIERQVASRGIKSISERRRFKFPMDSSDIPPIYWNDEVSVECEDGLIGPKVTIYASTVSSTTSKEDANQKALDEANRRLVCKFVYWNTEQTVECPEGYEGSSVIVPAKEFSSTISQKDADAKALVYGESQLTCNFIYWNDEITVSCEDGYVGEPVTVNSGEFSSTLSQQDANQKALNYAESQLVCNVLYWNTEQTAKCESGYEGESITTPANTFSSTISQQDADQQALNHAESQLVCKLIYWNQEVTVECGEGYEGEPVTIPANTHSSTISQQDADQKALDEANDQLVCNLIYWNTEQIAECGDGYQGEPVTIPANTFSSTISQQDADQKALDEANDQLVCNLIYWNTEQIAECEDGYEGEPVIVPAKEFSSTISQQDADQQARDYAEFQLVCYVIYWNTTQTAECDAGYQGDSVTIPANSYSSIISQQDADQKALDEANSQLVCNFIYWNTEQTAECEDGYEGESVTTSANTFSSIISQQDADQQALNHAKSQLVCNFVYWNTEQTAECGEGYQGDTVIVSANEFSSTISQQDADQQALNHAESQLVCKLIYWNTEQTAECEDGYEGDSVTVPANTFSSIISQQDADQKALNDAESRLICKLIYWNTTQTAECGEGYQGEPVTVPANTYSSIISQQDADQQALDDAESRLICNLIYWNTTQTVECGDGYEGESVTIPANSFSSIISQQDADQKALDEANSQLVCNLIYWNREVTAECGEGYEGEPVTIPANTYSSIISQQDADQQALNHAESQLSCELITVYWNTEVTECCPGYIDSDNYARVITAGQYGGNPAIAEPWNGIYYPQGQYQGKFYYIHEDDPSKYIINNGTLWFLIQLEKDIIDDYILQDVYYDFSQINLGSSGHTGLPEYPWETYDWGINTFIDSEWLAGVQVVGPLLGMCYTVDAGEFSSTISQQDANQQAINEALSQLNCPTLYWNEEVTECCDVEEINRSYAMVEPSGSGNTESQPWYGKYYAQGTYLDRDYYIHEDDPFKYIIYTGSGWYIVELTQLQIDDYILTNSQFLVPHNGWASPDQLHYPWQSEYGQSFEPGPTGLSPITLNGPPNCYTVESGKYSSVISQANANQRAKYEIGRNLLCTPIIEDAEFSIYKSAKNLEFNIGGYREFDGYESNPPKFYGRRVLDGIISICRRGDTGSPSLGDPTNSTSLYKFDNFSEWEDNENWWLHESQNSVETVSSESEFTTRAQRTGAEWFDTYGPTCILPDNESPVWEQDWWDENAGGRVLDTTPMTTLHADFATWVKELFPYTTVSGNYRYIEPIQGGNNGIGGWGRANETLTHEFKPSDILLTTSQDIPYSFTPINTAGDVETQLQWNGGRGWSGVQESWRININNLEVGSEYKIKWVDKISNTDKEITFIATDVTYEYIMDVPYGEKHSEWDVEKI